MCTQETLWDGVLIEDRGLFIRFKGRWKGSFITEDTMKCLPEFALSTFWSGAPRTQDERRLVTDVLKVSTIQLSLPITCIVLAIADDTSLHRLCRLGAFEQFVGLKDFLVEEGKSLNTFLQGVIDHLLDLWTTLSAFGFDAE